MKKWQRKIKKLRKSLQEVNRLLDKAVEEEEFSEFEKMWDEAKSVLLENWEHYSGLNEDYDCLSESKEEVRLPAFPPIV
jgi:DNA-binding transcriptional regulator GbsR (MarR family)